MLTSKWGFLVMLLQYEFSRLFRNLLRMESIPTVYHAISRLFKSVVSMQQYFLTWNRSASQSGFHLLDETSAVWIELLHFVVILLYYYIILRAQYILPQCTDRIRTADIWLLLTFLLAPYVLKFYRFDLYCVPERFSNSIGAYDFSQAQKIQCGAIKF